MGCVFFVGPVITLPETTSKLKHLKMDEFGIQLSFLLEKPLFSDISRGELLVLGEGKTKKTWWWLKNRYGRCF